MDSEHQRELWREASQRALDEVQKAGVKVYHPDKEPFREAVRVMHEAYRDTDLYPLIQEIKAIR